MLKRDTFTGKSGSKFMVMIGKTVSTSFADVFNYAYISGLP